MSMIKGFMDFVREQGVVGLAVGLAIGTQAGEAVKSIVDNFINPFVGIVLQGTTLEDIESVVQVGKSGPVTFGWGVILQSLITLVATAAVIYFVIERAGLTKLDKKKK